MIPGRLLIITLLIIFSVGYSVKRLDTSFIADITKI